MPFRKRECPLPRINWWRTGWRKEWGQAEWCTGLFLVLFLTVLLCCCLQLKICNASAAYLEDALAASNLASAVPDLESYGKSREIVLQNPLQAYERFCRAIKANLQLDENWESGNKDLIAGKVCVEKYIVYNVMETVVEIAEVTPAGEVHMWQGILGTVRAPNGVVVEATGIYSEISYPVKGFAGMEVVARKGKLVDIVENEVEEE